jgi:hypothetical protein
MIGWIADSAALNEFVSLLSIGCIGEPGVWSMHEGSWRNDLLEGDCHRDGRRAPCGVDLGLIRAR